MYLIVCAACKGIARCRVQRPPPGWHRYGDDWTCPRCWARIMREWRREWGMRG